MDELLTRTQRIVKNLLSDGRARTAAEIATYLDPAGLGCDGLVNVHICHIRKVISRFGLSILCERNGDGASRYRMVRYIGTD